MDAVGLIAEYEQGPRGGVALAAYRCPAGVWTCGWGETDGVGPGMRWTKVYADQRFCDSLTERAAAVRRMVTVHTTDHELGALVSLAYNIGLDGLRRSSVLAAHNRGDKHAAARAFDLWNKATVNGVLTVLGGLVARRKREGAMYLTPDYDAPTIDPMPQAVAPETSLARSPIISSGAVTAGAGVVTAIVNAEPDPAPVVAQPAKPDLMAKVEKVGKDAKTAKTAVQQVKEFATDTLGIPGGFVLPAVLIIAGVVVIYWRHKQRMGGWA